MEGAETKPKERQDGFSDERRRLFLVALRRGDSVLAACAAVGVSNRTAYNHRKRDPGFARDWAVAREAAVIPLELAAYERALGIEEPVYTYGKLTHHRRRSSDSVLIALLRSEESRDAGAAQRKAELAQLEARLERRLAAALAPLRTELDALRGARGVNVVNPPLAPAADTPAPAAQSEGRRGRGGNFFVSTSSVKLRRKALDLPPASGQNGRERAEKGSR